MIIIDFKFFSKVVPGHLIRLEVYDGLPNLILILLFLGPMSYNNADVVVLILYSVTNQSSFDNVRMLWAPEINRYRQLHLQQAPRKK